MVVASAHNKGAYQNELISIFSKFLPEFQEKSIPIEVKNARIRYIRDFIENSKKDESPDDMKVNAFKSLGNFLKKNRNYNIINKLSSLGIDFNSPNWLNDLSEITTKFGAELGNPEDAIELAKIYANTSRAPSSIIAPDPNKALEIRQAILSTPGVSRKVHTDASYDLGKQILSLPAEQASPALRSLGNKLLHRAKFLGHPGDFSGLPAVGDYKGESPLNVKEEMELIQKAQRNARDSVEKPGDSLVARPSVQSTGTIQPPAARTPLVAQTSVAGSPAVPPTPRFSPSTGAAAAASSAPAHEGIGEAERLIQNNRNELAKLKRDQQERERIHKENLRNKDLRKADAKARGLDPATIDEFDKRAERKIIEHQNVISSTENLIKARQVGIDRRGGAYGAGAAETAAAASSVPPTPRGGTSRPVVPPLPSARREVAHAAGIESVPSTPRSTIGILPHQRVFGAPPEPSFVPQVDLTHAGTNIASLYPQDSTEDIRSYLRRLAIHGSVEELAHPTPYLGARVAPLDQDELLATEGFRKHLANRRQAPAEAKLTKMYEELMRTDPEMAKKVQEDLARYGKRSFEDPDFEKYRNQYSNNVLNVMKKRFDRNVQDDLEKLTTRYRQLNALNTPAFQNEKAKLLERARESWGDQEKLLLESREREARAAWNEDQKKILDRVRAGTDTMEREKQRRLASGAQYGSHVAGSEDRDISNLELQRMYGQNRRAHHQAEADAARGAHDEATALRQYNINRLANVSAGHALPEPGIFEPTPPTAEAASASPWVGAGAAVNSIGRHITEQQNTRRAHELKQQELQQQRAAHDLRAQELELLRSRPSAPATTPKFKDGGSIKSFRDQYKDQYFKKAMDQSKRLMNEEESHGSFNNLLSGFTKGLLKRPKDVVGWDSLNHGFEGVVDAQESASKNMKETRDKADVLQEAVLNTLYKVDKEEEEAALKKASHAETRRKNDASIAHMGRQDKLAELKLALEHGYDPENKFGTATGFSSEEKKLETQSLKDLNKEKNSAIKDAQLIVLALKQREKEGWTLPFSEHKETNSIIKKVSAKNRPDLAESFTPDSDVKNLEEKLQEINNDLARMEYIQKNYRRPGDLERLNEEFEQNQIDELKKTQSNNKKGSKKKNQGDSSSNPEQEEEKVPIEEEHPLHDYSENFGIDSPIYIPKSSPPQAIRKGASAAIQGLLSPLNLAGIDVEKHADKLTGAKFDKKSFPDRISRDAAIAAAALIPSNLIFRGLGLGSRFPKVAKGFELNTRNFLGAAGAGAAASEAVHQVGSENPWVNLAVGIPAALVGGAGTDKIINIAARNIFKSGAAKTLPEAKNIVLKNLKEFGFDPSGKDVIKEGSNLEAIYNWLSKYGGIGKKEQKRILQNETQAKKILDIEGKTESTPGKAVQPLQEKLQQEATAVHESAAGEKAKLFEKLSEQSSTLPKTLREKASSVLPKDAKVKVIPTHLKDELLGYDQPGFKSLVKEMQSKQGISFERLMEIRSSLNMMKNTDPSGKLYKISDALEKDIKHFISKQGKEIQEKFGNYNKKYSEFFTSIGKDKANKNFSDKYKEIIKSHPHEFYEQVKGLWKEQPEIFTNMINKASSEELKPLSRELVYDLFKKGEGTPSLGKVVTNYFSTHMPDFQRKALNEVFNKANPELAKLGGLPKLMETLEVITKHSPEGIKKLVQQHREKSLEGIKTTLGVWAASVTLKAVTTAGGLRRGMEWVLSHPEWVLKLQNLPKTDFNKFFSDSVKKGIVPSNVANQILKEVSSSNDKK